MTPQIGKLTPETIATLPPGRHGDGGNLFLQKLPGGTMSWLFRYELKGKAHGMGLGPVDADRLADSLADARQRAAQARATLRAGRDPLADKKALAAAAKPAERPRTFSEAAGEYMSRHSGSWRSPVHARQWQQCLDDYVLPKIGRTAVADVSSADVKRVLEPLWNTRKEVARKVVGKIGLVLNLAIANGWRSAANVSTLPIMKTVLGPLPKKPTHHASMPWRDVPDFYAKLAERKDVAALAIRFLVLSTTRSSETRFATWREFDLAKGLWTIPAARMKNGEPHAVPLSLAALDVLRAIPRTRDDADAFVFAGRDGAISDTACRLVLRGLGLAKRDCTLHGFRSSFRDWAAENGIADDVAEACLAHTVRDDVVRAYKRTKFDQGRREALGAWGYFVSFG